MISFYLNTEQIVNDFNLSREKVEDFIDSVVKGITLAYSRRWENEAKLSLHQTRKRYIGNLKVIDEGRMQGAVLLDYSKDKLIRMIEEGANAFDMKEGFKNSAKSHQKKDGGWYITIPFRFATPGSIADSDLFAAVMPQEIYDVVKQQEIDTKEDGQGFKSKGLSLDEIPAKYRAPETRASVSVVETKKTYGFYVNKTSIYEGLSKVQDSVTGNNIYMSFRRVSDKSDPDSFIFTGMNAYNLAEKAMAKFDANIENEMKVVADNAFQGL